MKSFFFLCLIYLSISLQAKGMASVSNPVDTLVLVHAKKGYEYQIPEGEKIKVYLHDRSSIEGILTEAEDDFLLIGKRRIDMDQVESINYLTKKAKKSKKAGMWIGAGLIVILTIVLFSIQNPDTVTGGNLGLLATIIALFLTIITLLIVIGLSVALIGLIAFVFLGMGLLSYYRPRFRLSKFITRIARAKLR